MVLVYLDGIPAAVFVIQVRSAASMIFASAPSKFFQHFTLYEIISEVRFVTTYHWLIDWELIIPAPWYWSFETPMLWTWDKLFVAPRQKVIGDINFTDTPPYHWNPSWQSKDSPAHNIQWWLSEYMHRPPIQMTSSSNSFMVTALLILSCHSYLSSNKHNLRIVVIERE